MVSLVSTPSPCTRLSSLLFWRSTAQAWCVRACVCVCACVRARMTAVIHTVVMERQCINHPFLSLSLYMYLLYTLGTSYDASLRSLHLPT